MSNLVDMSTLEGNHRRVAELLDHEWRLLIGGSLCGAARTYPDESPVTEEVIAGVPDADGEDVAWTASAADEAAEGWRRTPARERAALLRELAEAIAARSHDLALLDSIDCGAPIGEMRRDVDVAVTRLRDFAGLATEIKGSTIPASANLHYTERVPFGVVARIIPFNHPFMFAAAKIAAPLVAGNCVLLKPPDVAPLSALLLGELAEQIFPPGVLSVLVGAGPAVPRAIVRHPAVRRIGFIGSETTGRSIQRDAAETGVKEVSLELGGKNALIAFPDADPADVAAGALAGMNFGWAGQSCGSTSRLLVHSGIAGDVVGRLVEVLGSYEFTSPLDPACRMGTLASRAQLEKALSYVDIAMSEGAKVLTGGGTADHPGLFMEPTVLGNVRQSFRVAQEEIFGPVLSVLTWEHEEDVIQMANSVRYGLTASIWTNDLRRAHRVARAVDAGYVWVNGASRHYPGVPFGGVKASGIGREESIEEILSYTQLKAVNVIL